ncbi:hypothetical protein L3X38_013551 [Prunus dulcis]|uniref:Uncharacterized protein n=1 Tax=Prunus dulcis TaxID=3755 RepID=A0AAD4WLQ1_PRUDU|nr:hypothetical protein L3X38_013551 [Prunus dulcis]
MGLSYQSFHFSGHLENPTGLTVKLMLCLRVLLSAQQRKGLFAWGGCPRWKFWGHPSVGGSLFHSGWGSVIETLQFGHVPVVLPFIIDQPLNARLLVEKDLAVERKEGEKLRSNARKAAKVFGDHKLHQDQYIGQFFHYLKNNVTRRSF